MTSSTLPKLQKFLADVGLGSRREIERWIQAGRIKIDNRVAQIGERVAVTATIFLDDECIWPQSISKTELPTSVWLYHKPVGEICTRHDPQGRPTVFTHLPQLTQQRWISIGRLDFNTSGLLLFTTDGELAARLQHPSWEIPRTYDVRVYGKVSENICQQLLTGVQLSDGMAKFLTLEHLRGEGANHWYRVVIAEGRNREVRRLWENQQVQVNRLIRVGFGPIQLPQDLLPKQGHFLSQELTQQLYQQVKMPPI